MGVFSVQFNMKLVGAYLLIGIGIALTHVKLFRDSDELQQYQESKFSVGVGAKRELEIKLTNLNGLLGRSNDIDKIQIDSGESAEVFQLRDITRQRRSPKKVQREEIKRKEVKGKEI